MICYTNKNAYVRTYTISSGMVILSIHMVTAFNLYSMIGNSYSPSRGTLVDIIWYVSI